MTKCPHCHHAVFFGDTVARSVDGVIISGPAVYASELGETVGVTFLKCPNCLKLVVSAVVDIGNGPTDRYVWPPAPSRPVAKEVPSHVASDFAEAVETLPASPKASAALSRRCLQTVLSEAGGSKKTNLSDQIDDVLPKLPSELQNSLDAIRNIGNFAAHTTKSTSSGTIIQVDPEEAEWNLDVLEELFDYYYARPARVKRRRDSLNQKLQDAGRPLMK